MRTGWLLLSLIAGLTVACGSKNPTPPAKIVVTISSAPSFLALSESRQFVASVEGTEDRAVRWEVSGGRERGMITSGGYYTAPGVMPVDSLVVVRAASVAAPTVSDQVTFPLRSGGVAVLINPSAVAVSPGQSVEFQARVEGNSDQRVTWDVLDGTGRGAVTASGRYTAPSTPHASGEAFVRATCTADPSKTALAFVRLLAPGITVQVQPGQARVRLGESVQFQAQVAGSTNRAVTWTVAPGLAYGTVDASGRYTAPVAMPATPFATIEARSVADPERLGSASVTLLAPVPESIKNGLPLALSAGDNAWLWFGAIDYGFAVPVIVQASRASGDSLTTTGTLTTFANGSAVYSPEPRDRLVWIDQGFPASWSIEFVIDSLEMLDVRWERNHRISAGVRFLVGGEPRAAFHYDMEQRVVVSGTGQDRTETWLMSGRLDLLPVPTTVHQGTFEVAIESVTRPTNDVTSIAVTGTLQAGDWLRAEIDESVRRLTARNYSGQKDLITETHTWGSSLDAGTDRITVTNMESLNAWLGDRVTRASTWRASGEVQANGRRAGGIAFNRDPRDGADDDGSSTLKCIFEDGAEVVVTGVDWDWGLGVKAWAAAPFPLEKHQAFGLTWPRSVVAGPGALLP